MDSDDRVGKVMALLTKNLFIPKMASVVNSNVTVRRFRLILEWMGDTNKLFV